MKRLASLLLVAILIVTTVSASLLSVLAADVTSIAIAVPEKVTYTGDKTADGFQVAFNLNLADGLEAIAGYDVTVRWDSTLLAYDSVSAKGELLEVNDTNAASGSVQVGVANAANLISGEMFTVNFHPLAETAEAVITVEVESMASASGVIQAEGSSATVAVDAVTVAKNEQVTVDVNAESVLTDDVTDVTDSWASGLIGGKVKNVMNGNCKEVGMDVTLLYALGETKKIDGVTVYFYHDANSMIGYPEGKATVLVSSDGETYNSVGEFDLVAADLTACATVKNEFTFNAVDAAYVKVLVYAGSNEAVRGDADWGGKVNWEFISLTEVDVSEVPVTLPVQPETLVTLPEGAYVLDFAGYKHASVHSIVAGDGKTVSELTALGNNGAAKDMNYAYIAVVNANGVVVQTWYELGVSKADVVCPVGGYILSFNGNKSNYADLANVKVGDLVTLYNIDLEALKTLEGNVAVTNAGFTFSTPEAIDVTVNVNEYAVLTDGTTEANGDWFVGPDKLAHLIYNGSCKTAGMNVTLLYNLGETKKIDGVSLYFFNDSDTMIGYPEGKVTVMVSTDGETYTSVGEFDLEDAQLSGTSLGTVANVFTFDEAVDAAYVKAVFYVGSAMEYLGRDVSEGKIYWEFISLTEVAVSEVEVPAYKLGDIDADGEITAKDYTILKRAVLRSYEMSEDEASRADVTKDGEITAKDYMVLKSVVLRRATIED